MSDFLDRYQAPKINQDQVNYLNSLKYPNGTEAVIKNFPTKKGPRPDGFHSEYYQTFKEEVTPICLNLFHKIATKGTLPTFYVLTDTLTSEPHKDKAKKNF